jgi:hypothetical protein
LVFNVQQAIFQLYSGYFEEISQNLAFFCLLGDCSINCIFKPPKKI